MHKNEQVKGKIDALKKFKANVLTDLGQTFPNELAKYRALRSSCYGTSSVVPPPPPSLNMLSSVTSLGGPVPQQQNLLGGSIQQQQLNNTSVVTTAACLNNSQQQSNSSNISSLLGCDGISTVSTSINSNNIGGPPCTQ